MPRVLLTGFCAVPGPRRAGVQLRHVIRALTPHHSVDLLVLREGEQAYVERQGSVRVLRVPTHESDLRAQIQSFQRALKRQLEGAEYDIVHCRDAWSGIPVLEARSRLGYAVVYDLARAPLGESALDPELDAQYGRDEEACLLAADMILAPTPAAAKALADAPGGSACCRWFDALVPLVPGRPEGRPLHFPAHFSPARRVASSLAWASWAKDGVSSVCVLRRSSIVDRLIVH